MPTESAQSQSRPTDQSHAKELLRELSPAPLVVGIALVSRFFGVAITSVTDANPYAQVDVNQFSAAAARIAFEIRTGAPIVVDTSRIIEVWGLFLSPFWLLPGPSWVYARIACAVLGVLAVYNVFLIGREFHSPSAGVIAALPLASYPSIVLVHSTILRESAALFGLTCAARIAIQRREARSLVIDAGLVTVLLGMVTVLRVDNFPVYLLTLVTATVLHLRSYLPRGKYTLGMIAATVTAPVWGRYAAGVVNELARIRARRAFGRTVYLPHVLADSLPEAIAFSYIGAAYFLFAPFPWMVTRFADFVVAIEGLVNLCAAAAAVLGVRDMLRTRYVPATGALSIGLLVGVTLYGFGTANVGTAVRHRQMFLWIVFVFAAVAIRRRIVVRS
jgi:hypothetical protein